MRRELVLRYSIHSYVALAIVSAKIVGFGMHSSEAYEPIVGEPHADFILPRIDSQQPVASKFLRRQIAVIVNHDPIRSSVWTLDHWACAWVAYYCDAWHRCSG